MASHEKRIPSLDGLRAVSIICVLFSHAALGVHLPAWAECLTPAGNFGVRVFFVISGFLITSLLLDENKTRGRISLSAFYMRRALRILPVYYIYILTVFTLDRSIGLTSTATSSFFSAGTFTTRLWGDWRHNDFPLSDWPLIHSWSLSVEEQFYLLWPAVLCWLTVRKGGSILLNGGGVALAIILLAAASRFLFRYVFLIEDLAGHLFLTQADSIMCGCLLALLARFNRPAFFRTMNFYPHISRVAVVALLLAAYYWLRLGVLFVFGPLLQSVAIAFLIGSFTVVKSGISYNFLNHRLMQWIGRLSYSLYIWQQLFLFPRSLSPSWVQQFPQNLAFVFLVAAASYYFIEKPLLKLKKHFSRIRNVPERPA